MRLRRHGQQPAAAPACPQHAGHGRRPRGAASADRTRCAQALSSDTAAANLSRSRFIGSGRGTRLLQVQVHGRRRPGRRLAVHQCDAPAAVNAADHLPAVAPARSARAAACAAQRPLVKCERARPAWRARAAARAVQRPPVSRRRARMARSVPALHASVQVWKRASGYVFANPCPCTRESARCSACRPQEPCYEHQPPAPCSSTA